jgi:predicted Fe-S protein YdhL (DUF1289 family)
MCVPYKLDTPCVGVCSTVYGDDICRGCKRSSTEVIEWNTLDNQNKQEIFDRLGQQISNICQDYLLIRDTSLLKQTLNEFHIRYREEQTPLTWAYYLLRSRATKKLDLKEAGLSVNEKYQHLTLVQLFTIIDEKLISLAEIHYKCSVDFFPNSK